MMFARGKRKPQEEIAKTLSVTPRSVSSYLSDIDKQLREDRKQRIFDMWMACHTQEEIAKEVLGDADKHKTIDNELKELVNLEALPKLPKLASLYQDDFEPPLYNGGNTFRQLRATYRGQPCLPARMRPSHPHPVEPT